MQLLPGRRAKELAKRPVIQLKSAVARAELVEKGIGDLVSERTVDVHIKELRHNLESEAWRIETVRGRGYRNRCEQTGA
jgi:DNA-binding response OmpR family regulator